MAASMEQTALGQLGQEATCPVCLDFFKQPMALSCGHNFCCDCLVRLGTEPSCPQCRAKVDPGSACPNWALANIIGHLKRLQPSEGHHQESSSHGLCQEHGLCLEIFCCREKSLLCPGCLGGHQGHRLLSLPEAAQEYKDLLDGLLEPLRKEGQKLLEQRQAEEQSRQQCQEQFADEEQKVVLAVKSLQELLRESQQLWLAWLSDQEEKMEADWGVTVVQFSREESHLQQLIAQTDRKCRQPDWEFLQDIQDTVGRCRSYLVGRSEMVAPSLHGRFQNLLEKNAYVRQLLDFYKDSLQKTLTGEKLERRLASVCVMPNECTAHPQLQCLNGTICWARGHQECPDGPERFDEELCVLGIEGFTTGWNRWKVMVQEVEFVPVQGRACWAVGVARESVRRKGSFKMSPQEGIWAVGKNVERENVAFSEVQHRLGLQSRLKTLRVSLDYEAEKVEFLDVYRDISLYTFRMGPLYGETLRPFFYVGHEGVFLTGSL